MKKKPEDAAVDEVLDIIERYGADIFAKATSAALKDMAQVGVEDEGRKWAKQALKIARIGERFAADVLKEYK